MGKSHISTIASVANTSVTVVTRPTSSPKLSVGRFFHISVLFRKFMSTITVCLTSISGTYTLTSKHILSNRNYFNVGRINAVADATKMVALRLLRVGQYCYKQLVNNAVSTMRMSTSVISGGKHSVPVSVQSTHPFPAFSVGVYLNLLKNICKDRTVNGESVIIGTSHFVHTSTMNTVVRLNWGFTVLS